TRPTGQASSDVTRSCGRPFHRPRHWLRPEAFNASGWVIISALWYARGIILLVIRGGPRPYASWVDAGVSLGMLLLVDALLALRLLSWWRYTRKRPDSDVP
ncbi:hypothetical protein ACWD7F_38290, partial [Streptomyces sp. NPDC005122]